MPVSVDRLFGIHAEALTLRARRGEVLASNLANVDTPNYKAQDVDFRSALKRVQDQQAVGLTTTSVGHIQGHRDSVSVQTQYRVPHQPSLDGNTVDAHIEQSSFAENAVRYQVSLRFLNGKIHSLMAAIRGE